MSEPIDISPLQDHAAFLAGSHDFQSDIETIAASRLVGTLLETVMMATGVRFAGVARVTEERWVACRSVDELEFGLAEGDEMEISSTFCQSVRETSEKVVFNNSATDEVYAGHPIAERFGIVSYASIPIRRRDGSFFGTLCAIDTVARDLKNPRAQAMLEMFAELIGQGLDTEKRIEEQDREILRQRELAQIQEEFVAVLGHDLRNPVAALMAGVRQLEKEVQSERARMILPLMRASLRRTNELIDNIMLHAKARLGGGIRVSPVPDAPLAEALTQIVEEFRMTEPETPVELDLQLGTALECDAARISQAVGNLLSNALQHGTEGAPIMVRGGRTREGAMISVSNSGGPIPEALHGELFQPFRRGRFAAGEGLGLGLHIAHSIATAHGGCIDVSDEGGRTTFTLRVPMPPAVQ